MRVFKGGGEVSKQSSPYILLGPILRNHRKVIFFHSNERVRLEHFLSFHAIPVKRRIYRGGENKRRYLNVTNTAESVPASRHA